MRLSFAVSAPSALWRRLPGARTLARETLAAAAQECGFPPRGRAEVSLRLSDDAELSALNARWRGLDKPTNVLAFPAAPPERNAEAPMLGDVIIAYETTAREAAEAGKPLADHFRHLVAHGFLHLIGYDHQSPDEAERMETLERRILARLGVADPYEAPLAEAGA